MNQKIRNNTYLNDEFFVSILNRLKKHLDDYEVETPLDIINTMDDPNQWLISMMQMKLERLKRSKKEEAEKDSLKDLVGYAYLYWLRNHK